MKNKEKFVEELFDDLSVRYDLFNDILSLGMHRIWKKKLITLLKPSENENWLDLCCGTGDLAINLAKKVQPNGKIVGIDTAKKTLEVAKNKSNKFPIRSIDWINNDIFKEQNYPQYFDGAVMAYGLRNLIDPFQGFKTIRNFLKPGAKAGILDFNIIKNKCIKSDFQKFYFDKIILPVTTIYGFGHHFSYLKMSLLEFPSGKSQVSLALKAGFKKAKYFEIAFGQMGILILEN